MTTDRMSRRCVLTGFGVTVVAASFARAGLARAQAAGAAASGPPPLDAYSKLAAVDDVAISPDGTHIAFISSKNDDRVVVDYEVATKKMSAAAIAGVKYRDVMWADNSHVVVQTSLAEKFGGEQYETWLANVLDIPGDKQVVLYHGIPGVNSNQISGSVYRVKTSEGYRVTAGGYQTPDEVNMVNSDGSNVSLMESVNCVLFSFSPASGHGIRLDADARDVQDWAVRYDTGKVVARTTYDDQKKLWVLDYFGEHGWKNLMSLSQARFDLPELRGLGRDGASLLLRRTDAEGFPKYSEVDPAGHETPIDLPAGNHYSIHHPATGALMAFGSDKSMEDYVVYDPVLAKVVPLVTAALPGCFNRFAGCAEDVRKLLVYSEGSDDSGSYYRFDFTTGDAESIGAVHPGISPQWVAETRLISYKASDGMEIPAYVTALKGDQKGRPLVVLPHPNLQGFNEFEFDWMSQALASRGYVVLLPQYRGSGGHGQAFTAAGYGELGRKMQTDLSDGVRHLVDTGMVDPKRVAIAGSTFGGYAALAGVTLQKGVYNCAISIGGISDLKGYLDYVRQRSDFNSNSYVMQYMRRYTGDKIDDISPINGAANVDVPVLLIHGTEDAEVPLDQSLHFCDTVTRAGHSAELVKLEKEDHWLSKEATRVQTLQAMVDFLAKHNPA